MRPINFSMREGCHWHLSEIFKAEEEFGRIGVENKILEFLDLEGKEEYYTFLEDFLQNVFEQTCAARMAVFQYICAQYRICYTEAPAYMHYMRNAMYSSYTDLLNDEDEYPYLSNEVKNKLAEYEKLTAVGEEWKKMYQNSQETITGLHDTINSLHIKINEFHKKDVDRILEERKKRTESVTVENATETAAPIELFTEQLAEKDRQIEALIKLLQSQKNTQQ